MLYVRTYMGKSLTGIFYAKKADMSRGEEVPVHDC